MNAQTFRTPTGEEMVILSRTEFDALISRLEELQEDQNDLAAYDTGKAAMRDDPGVVTTNVDQIRGILIRRHRKLLNMTQEELAQAIGVQQGFVSDLESGRRRGSAETIDKISVALALEPQMAEALKSGC